MRNLKKILALVLTLVMSFSLVSVASATESTDEDIKAEYAESVEILNYLGVFRGYEDGTFKPQNTISRAEVAAIIYRIDTGDVNDAQVKIYADYDRFEDVDSNAWYAGYVNYCANAEYVKGVSDTKFDPNGKVTGYQALAMILRVVGYDQNDEFTGSAWQIEVAKYANKLGITDNVNANTLGISASRELIAELLWRTMYDVPQVTYTLALGYNQYKDLLDKDEYNDTINEEKFGVFHECDTDEWGRPGVSYYQYNRNYYITGFRHTPVYTGYTALTECDVYSYMGLRQNQWVDVYENSNRPLKAVGVENERYIEKHHDKHTHADHMVGEQGTLMELYHGLNYDGTAYITRIVLIDTYLATVDAKNPEKVDKAGHKYQIASNDITVFAHEDLNANDNSFRVDYGTYNRGDIILTYVNNFYYDVARTDATGKPIKDVDGNIIYDTVCDVNVQLEYTREPAVVEGKQTVVKFNSGKHYIEKVEYNDNVNFVYDEAGFDKNNTYYWFFDEQNNVMGSVLSPEAVRYAIVTDAQWINGVGTYGYAQATLYFVGGETETDTIYKVNGTEAHYVDTKSAIFDAAQFCTTYQYNDNTAAHLYEVTESPYGLVLNKVETELANAVNQDGKFAEAVWLKDGVSAVKIGDTQVNDYAQYVYTGTYVDNNTTYVYWIDSNGDGWVDTLESVIGYDNLPREIKGHCVDVVYNYNNTTFASIVYIPYEGTIGTGVTDKFVYVTDKAMTYALKNYFAVSGVIGADGDTEPLYFAPNWYGNDIETQATLDAMVEMYKDTMLKVTIDNSTGICTAVVPVLTGSETLSNNVSSKQDIGCWVPYGSYFFVNAGVVKVGNLALNVNASTVIVNDDGTGLQLDDLLQIVGKDLYIVYKGTTAKAIFVIGDLANQTPFLGVFSDVTADDFVAETVTEVYEIVSDDETTEENEAVKAQEAFVCDVIANSTLNDVFGMAGKAIAVESCETTLSENGKSLEATVTLAYTYEEWEDGTLVEKTANRTITLTFKAK